MHINEVDGLMPHFSNRPLGEHWLSLSCSSGAQLIASEVVDQISFPRECLCCKWPFLSQWKAVKTPQKQCDPEINC